MSIKLMISFGDLGYGFIRKVSSIEIPFSWTNSRTISDVIKLVCEDYNTSKLSKAVASTAAAQPLNASDVYLASSDGKKLNSEDLCGRLTDGAYFIKMVCICKSFSTDYFRQLYTRSGNSSKSTGLLASPANPG